MVFPTSLKATLHSAKEAAQVPSIHLKGFSVESHALSPTHSIVLVTHLPFEHIKGYSLGHPLYSTLEQSSRHIPSSHKVVFSGHSKRVTLFLFSHESLSAAQPPSKHL